MLTNLTIRNYRAIDELRIGELGRINLISGRNNSGKTTLLEALLILSSGHPEITLHNSIIRGMRSERLPPAGYLRSIGNRCFHPWILGRP